LLKRIKKTNKFTINTFLIKIDNIKINSHYYMTKLTLKPLTNLSNLPKQLIYEI